MSALARRVPSAALFSATVRDDVLYHSERTRIVRRCLSDDGAPVVCKELLGPDAAVRMRHEQSMLERLALVAGIAHLVAARVETRMLVLEDVSGIPLAQVLHGQLLSVSQKIELALALARIVADVHRHGVVHRDINPANILVTGATWQPTLIDFNLASSFAEERPTFTHESAITGTLAYLSPEQTGRTSRAVDQRADLYSLGATFYELTTGRPPFEGTDPLQLIRDHLARLPIPPSQVDPAIPALLSNIVMRLLEKEPDRRYQSADGLAHDLARLSSNGQDFALGERDFAMRLTAPSRLVGRATEISALHQAFDASLHSAHRGMLVSGAPGVGKSALVGELRPMVTARGGWFVSGKFEQYRQEAASPAITQALRELGRLLLAEPKTNLDRQREIILAALGRQAGIITAALPEFLMLLGPQPELGEASPVEAEANLIQATGDLLGAVVSQARPLAIVIDDLQWARPAELRMFERLISDPDVRGLLVVGTFRDAEIDAAHPLAPLLSRWQELPTAPLRLSLPNLAHTQVTDLVAEMLRLPKGEAMRLAEALVPLTNGNPFDTVELINALRRDGILRCCDHGWQWESNAIRRYIGNGTVVDLIAQRIGLLPHESCELLETMACLGNSVEMTLLRAATGACADTLDAMLREPLEEGLLIPIRGEQAGTTSGLRFRHDRVQQAAHGRLDAAQREVLHLVLARRLLADTAFQLQAAEQYLPAVRAVRDPKERRQVAELFKAAAAQARQSASYSAVARWLTEAIAMVAGSDAVDASLVTHLEIELHAALYALGKLDEADRLYSAIEARNNHPLALADAASVQISSLCNRNCLEEAIALGLQMLRRLGLRRDEMHAHLVPARSPQLPTRDEDVLRPEVTDPLVIASGKIINRLLPAAWTMDSMAWMVSESRAMWVDKGPCAELVGPLCHTALVTIFNGDYRSGHDDVRHVLEVSEARGYQLQSAQARFYFAFTASHWFAPLEETVSHAQQAREGLLQGGDLQSACFTYLASTSLLFDSATFLGSAVDEIEAAIAIAARTGNQHAGDCYVLQRRLAIELQGPAPGITELPEAPCDVPFGVDERVRNPFSTALQHVTCGLAAALFGHDARLLHHAEEAYRHLECTESFYTSAHARLLYVLVLARRVRTTPEEQRTALIAELDDLQGWWQQRAADAPANFGHLALLVQAERARAENNFDAAARAYDLAMREVERRQRPWHRAFITERAGLFHLEQGLLHTGRKLLNEARGLYADWGAQGKVKSMERLHGFLSSRSVACGSLGERHDMASSIMSSDAIDLLGVLRASQALSSETSLARLTVRVSELLGSMTGATAVSVAIWDADLHEWRLLTPTLGSHASLSIPVAEAAACGMLPLTAFRYADRTRKPLLVEDAVRDARFASDPYFTGQQQCSLLLVPIDSHSEPRAMIVLENRLSSSAFSAARLDAVMLIAGQLAVSLDNALVYASLERKVAERTDALEEANRSLALMCATDPLTGISNRRHFAEILQAEWLRAMRPGLSMGLAMIDIDQFKLYNDHYGHPAGDACLQRVASTLKGGLRMTTDMVARYGGEEFVLVLPGTDLAGTHSACNRLRSEIAALCLPHEKSIHGVVTVSIGITAVVAMEDDNPQRHIAIADGALYEAKRAGRNRVGVAHSSFSESRM